MARNAENSGCHFRLDAIKSCREQGAPDLADCVTTRVRDYLAEVERIDKTVSQAFKLPIAVRGATATKVSESLVYVLGGCTGPKQHIQAV